MILLCNIQEMESMQVIEQERQKWAESYDGKVVMIEQLQRELAHTVEALHVEKSIDRSNSNSNSNSKNSFLVSEREGVVQEVNCKWCCHRIRDNEKGLCPVCQHSYVDDHHELSAQEHDRSGASFSSRTPPPSIIQQGGRARDRDRDNRDSDGSVGSDQNLHQQQFQQHNQHQQHQHQHFEHRHQLWRHDHSQHLPPPPTLQQEQEQEQAYQQHQQQQQHERTQHKQTQHHQSHLQQHIPYEHSTLQLPTQSREPPINMPHSDTSKPLHTSSSSQSHSVDTLQREIIALKERLATMLRLESETAQETIRLRLKLEEVTTAWRDSEGKLSFRAKQVEASKLCTVL